MPLYEYTCRACEHTFEALVFDGETVECPECQGRRLDRLVSVPAKPRTDAGTSLPRACGNPDLPPCGPSCGRL